MGRALLCSEPSGGPIRRDGGYARSDTAKVTNVAAVAFANKHARVIWALLAHDDVYRPPV